MQGLLSYKPWMKKGKLRQRVFSVLVLPGVFKGHSHLKYAPSNPLPLTTSSCSIKPIRVAVAQIVKTLPAMQEMPVQSLSWEDLLGKGMAQPTPISLPGKSHGQRSLAGL